MDVAIIGGGAAGFFSALSCKFHNPEANITIYEKTSKLLAKVKISGGGRCNVTHACFNINELSKFYPRGEKQLKKAFGQFGTQDTIEWFESRGVKIKTESDNRMFPVSDKSQTIIDCLTNACDENGINIRLNHSVKAIRPAQGYFNLDIKDQVYKAERVIITTGGNPKREGFQWLAALNHHIIKPVPSLFTFNMPNETITKLMGLSVQNAHIKVQSSKLKGQGPLLVTHWGMSGPAILKLSAYGARILNEMNYEFKIQVSWANQPESVIREVILNNQIKHSKKKVINSKPFDLPHRLWEFLLAKIELRSDIAWGEMGKKGINRMINILINDTYQIKGKTTFKEEFVTAGGVNLEDVDISTMQSKKIPGLYFAGEVLNIDGVTGGFNFQAAWTTGFIAGKLLA